MFKNSNESLHLNSLLSGVPGHFSENGFVMDSAEKELQFYAKEPISAADLSNTLSMRSYKNSLVEKRKIENNYQVLRNQL